MNTSQYTLFDQDTFDQLKLLGYNSVQLVLLDTGDRFLATVEVIPLKGSEFGLDIISLHSRDIHDYIDGNSPMAKYVIDQAYL